MKVELPDLDKFDIVESTKKLASLLEPVLMIGMDKSDYHPPKIEITVGGVKLDIINTFRSADITRRGGAIYEFTMELFDPTFTLEQMFLRTNVPIIMTYGNRNGEVTYKGTIFRTKATVALSQGVQMTVQGFFSQKSYLENKPSSYPASEYQGSVLSVLNKVAQEENMELIVRDEIEDVNLVDGDGQPRDIMSDASENTLQFITKMVAQLGPSIGFSIQPSNLSVLSDPKDQLIIFNQNNSSLRVSDNINLIVADLNHRDSNITDYDFDIQQTQYEKFGGTERYMVMDEDTNEIISSTSSTSDNNNNGDSLMQELSDTASQGFRYLTGSSGNLQDTNSRVSNRTMKKLQAMYKVTLNLMEGVPKAQPFLTQLSINSWITSPTNTTGAIKHHTSGDYMITEIVDHLTSGTLTSTIVAQRSPGQLNEPEPVDNSYDRKSEADKVDEMPVKDSDDRSLGKLQGVHPDMKKVYYRATELTSTKFIITCGRRTAKQQNELYQKGRTTQGPKVTDLDGYNKRSNHQPKSDGYGHAIDLAPVAGNKILWKDDSKFNEIARAMKQASQELNIPITWGGDWKLFIDKPHFELK